MPPLQADGHCLYRSLEDQLSQQRDPASEAAPTYQQLRERAAAYIRAHPGDFIPFVYDEVGVCVAPWPFSSPLAVPYSHSPGHLPP